MNTLKSVLPKAAIIFVIFSLLCGIVYTGAVTALAQLIFPHQANGSLITVDGMTVGAKNVGQEFTEDYYMWGRPSAYHYNVYLEDEEGNQTYTDGTEFPGIGSGSNNYAPSNPDLDARVQEDMENFLAKNPDVKKEDIPTDLLTASGSGLDPDISPASAEIQIPRIVKASGLSEDTVRDIISQNTEGKLLGIFGEETVNVLGVNIGIYEAMESASSDAE